MDFDKINIDGIPYMVKDSEGRQLVATEQSAREEADSQLQSKITAEQAAREEADSQLQSKITAEQTAREQADSQLSQKITAERTAREQADKQLKTQIDDIHMGASIDLSSVLFFGDSYTQGYTLTSPNTQAYWAVLSDMLHITGYQHFAGGGCGFKHISGSVGKTFQQYWNSISGQIVKPSEVTAIFFMGGYNDGDQTDIGSAVTSTMQAIHSTCPNATIYFLFNPAWAVFNNDNREAITQALDSLDYCRMFNSWWWLLYDDDLFSDDKVHPNAAGHSAIAFALASFLQGGSYEHRHNILLDIRSGYNAQFKIDNDTLRIYMSGNYSNGTTILTLPTGVNKNTSEDAGPSYRYRRVSVFDVTDNPTYLLYISMNPGSNDVTITAMKQIGGSNPPGTGNFFFMDSMPIQSLFG